MRCVSPAVKLNKSHLSEELNRIGAFWPSWSSATVKPYKNQWAWKKHKGKCENVVKAKFTVIHKNWIKPCISMGR